jgi:hypothetical protein
MTATLESGKGGDVKIASTTIGEVLRWTFTKRVNSNRFGTSASGGFKRSVGGVKEGSGTISMKYDVGAANTIAEGSAVTLKCYLDATHFYSIPALVTSCQVMADMDTGDAIGSEFSFDTDGAWVEPTLP